MSSELLKINRLNVSYGDRPVLDNLSFELPQNKVIGLIGFNGAGKSTLIGVMSGVIGSYKIDNLVFNNQNLNHFNHLAFKRQRYTVFDYDQSFGQWTLMHYLSFVHKAYEKKMNQQKLAQLIQGFHFEAYQDTALSKLSFGNQKKVFLIAGLLLELPLLLLDEPVDGLDFESTEFLYREIREYTQYGTVFIASHLLDSLNKISDDILILKDGHLSWKQNNDEIYRMMSHDY